MRLPVCTCADSLYIHADIPSPHACQFSFIHDLVMLTLLSPFPTGWLSESPWLGSKKVLAWLPSLVEAPWRKAEVRESLCAS